MKNHITPRFNTPDGNHPHDKTRSVQMTRKMLIKLLNEDLAREYQAVIAYVVYSQMLEGAAYASIAQELEKHAGEELQHALILSRQITYLGGTPTVTPKEVQVTHESTNMLELDLKNEQDTIRHYQQRIQQAEALQEYGLSEALRKIIAQEQDHAIDLSDALGGRKASKK